MTPPREEWNLDTRRLGRCVLVFDQLDSTNNYAAGLANDKANEGIAVLANVQTAGRGQHGRTWLAAPGQSVLLSLLLAPPPHLFRPVLLTAWAAVAVCEAIRLIVGCETRIKWPNDVLLHGRKVCGILMESAVRRESQQAADGGRRIAVVGIGLNVQQSAGAFAEAGLPEATSLTQYAAGPLETHAVAVALIRQLDRDYDSLVQGDLDALETRWQEHLALLDKPVAVECADGVHRGRLLELNFHGVALKRLGEPPLLLAPERIQHLREISEIVP